MSSNPFASMLEDAFGADHGIGIERQGLQYRVTIGDGPTHLVSSSNVAEALNEATEGVGRVEFLRLLGVPDGTEPAGDLDGDGTTDAGEDAAEPVVEETATDDSYPDDPDRCPVCGSAGGEDCREGCTCEWCVKVPAEAEPAAADCDDNHAAPTAEDEAPATDEAAPTATAEPAADESQPEPGAEPVVGSAPEPADPDAALAARIQEYETWSFNDLRREYAIRSGESTPRGTTKAEVALALARLDLAAAEEPAPAEPEPASPPPAINAPAPVLAPLVETGRLYRHADGMLLRILSDPDTGGHRMGCYFEHGGQIAGRMLGPADELRAVPDGTPFEPPTGHADPRIPAVGTVLSREHDGRTWRLRVDHSGFTLTGPDGGQGKERSLSSAARVVLGGTRVNGPAFWGLDDTPAERARREAEKTARRRERLGLRLVAAVAEWVAQGPVSPAVRDAVAAVVGKLGGESGT